MRRFVEDDLPVPVRWTEGPSTDTHENAVFSARLLRPQGISRIILVTSSAHMVRASAEFTAAGFEVTPAPAEMWTHDERGVLAFLPSVLALDRSHTALYEWAGRIVPDLEFSALSQALAGRESKSDEGPHTGGSRVSLDCRDDPTPVEKRHTPVEAIGERRGARKTCIGRHRCRQHVDVAHREAHRCAGAAGEALQGRAVALGPAGQ